MALAGKKLEPDSLNRGELIANSRRVVVKVGSGVLTSQERHRGAWVRGRHGRGQTPKSRILQGSKEGS